MLFLRMEVCPHSLPALSHGGGFLRWLVQLYCASVPDATVAVNLRRYSTVPHHCKSPEFCSRRAAAVT
jgi:hypothetical protein